MMPNAAPKVHQAQESQKEYHDSGRHVRNSNKLAVKPYFGKNILRQCTVMEYRQYPGLRQRAQFFKTKDLLPIPSVL